MVTLQMHLSISLTSFNHSITNSWYPLASNQHVESKTMYHEKTNDGYSIVYDLRNGLCPAA